MRITMSLELPADNEIQFYDACKGAAQKLNELGLKAIGDGDHEQFRGTTHDIEAANDDAEVIGQIKVSR